MSTIVILERPRTKLINQPFQVAKRLIDVALILALMPVVIPLLAVVAIAIKIDSPGPVLFKQKRIGKGGQLFEIYKLRTMRQNFDKSEHQRFMKEYIRGQAFENKEDGGQLVYKPAIENQITKIGHILRKTSIDELPQIFNILRGEMSFVGPRPNVLWEVEAYSDWHKERLEVKPGITGLAQVKGRSGISFDRLVKYDLEYVRTQSV
ncbi:MAG TPA: sugar transferase, partial [Chloroflexi bacterium]|nr:sugar transferase [Chloroflexota bacterium]